MRKLLVSLLFITAFTQSVYAWDECFKNDMSCVARPDKRVKAHYNWGYVQEIKVYTPKDSCKRYADIRVIVLQPDSRYKPFVLHAIPLLSRFYRGHEEIYITGLEIGDIITYIDIWQHINRTDENQGFPGCLQVRPKVQ